MSEVPTEMEEMEAELSRIEADRMRFNSRINKISALADRKADLESRQSAPGSEKAGAAIRTYSITVRMMGYKMYFDIEAHDEGEAVKLMKEQVEVFCDVVPEVA